MSNSRSGRSGAGIVRLDSKEGKTNHCGASVGRFNRPPSWGVKPRIAPGRIIESKFGQ